MLQDRLLWDEFFWKVKQSGIIYPDSTILDIGTGYNTTFLEMFGDKHKIISTDIYPEDYKDKIELKYLNAEDWSDSEFNDQYFECIFISEVLEHVKNPLQVLKNCYNHLDGECGIVVGTTPFWYRIHESSPEDSEIVEKHIKDYWRFTPSGIRLLLEQAEFTCIYADGFPKGVGNPNGIGFYGYKDDHAKLVIQNLDWDVEISATWREEQVTLVNEYNEKMKFMELLNIGG
jgi:SAM-dependent methyltransferase